MKLIYIKFSNVDISDRMFQHLKEKNKLTKNSIVKPIFRSLVTNGLPEIKENVKAMAPLYAYSVGLFFEELLFGTKQLKQKSRQNW